MSILQEIFKWSQSLPAWQSDAIARLLVKQLSTDDIDDLLALLKSEHGIPDPSGRKPKPLTTDQIPVPVVTKTQVVLQAMKSLQHVNAINERSVKLENLLSL